MKSRATWPAWPLQIGFLRCAVFALFPFLPGCRDSRKEAVEQCYTNHFLRWQDARTCVLRPGGQEPAFTFLQIASNHALIRPAVCRNATNTLIQFSINGRGEGKQHGKTKGVREKYHNDWKKKKHPGIIKCNFILLENRWPTNQANRI